MVTREATDGNPSTSRRWRFNQTMGSDQEMIARLRAPSGEVWGMLGLYREPGRSMFDADDKRFLRAVSGHLAVGARRALLVGEAIDLDGQQPDAPDLIIVSDRWELQSATPGVERWLDALPDGDSTSGRLPAAVIAVAARARRCAEQSQRHSATVVSRVMSKNGTWIVLHGACLVDAGARRIAVIVEPADPARIHPLLMAAYQLTARERRRSIRLSCPRVRASPGTGGCAGSLSGSSPHRRQRVRERHGSRSRRRRHGGVRRRERGTVPRVGGTARADGRHRGHGVIPDASSPALSFASPRGRIA